MYKNQIKHDELDIIKAQKKKFISHPLPQNQSQILRTHHDQRVGLARLSVKTMVVHNFTKEIKVVTNESKVVISKQKPFIDTNKKPIYNCPTKPKKPKKPKPIKPIQSLTTVYNLGDIFTGRRIMMKHLGLDIGTRTIVLAFRDGDEIKYISEINGWWPFERATKFIEHLLNDPNKIRSDGTKRPARWIKMPETGQIVILGRDAEEFAYAKNDTLRRPMADGGVSADTESMTILASITQGIIEMAEKEIGKFGDEVKITYCTTADAINKDSSNVDYHERVVNMIINSYNTDSKIALVGPYDDRPGAIKESHAIVLEMSEKHDGDGTGIGISWGAGTVTVSYIKWGQEIYSFCWVGAGDWIDSEVAKRHGYDPETARKKSKETPTTVSRRKETIDLTPGIEISDRIGLDIVLHYDVLINRVINGIISGFIENESEARMDNAIPIYMAGGTSSPKGFTERVIKKLDESELPFEVSLVLKSEEPLYCVAAGCLRAAELFT